MGIISLLASDNYIVVNKDILKKFGINVTLMLGELASEYNYWDKEGKMEDGMFYSTIENIEENTGLSKYRQSEALKSLSKLGVVQTVVKGQPAKRYFKLDIEKLENLFSNNSTSSCQKTGKLDGEKLETNNNNITIINNSNKKKESKGMKRMTYDEQIESYSDNEDLRQALKAFIQMRKMVNKPLTDYALALILAKLDKLSNDDATKTAIVNQSVEHSWQGVFPLKDVDIKTDDSKYCMRESKPDDMKPIDYRDFLHDGKFDKDGYDAACAKYKAWADSTRK